jgi:signal transduction histidine kinase
MTGFRSVLSLFGAAFSHDMSNRLQGAVGFMDLLVRSETDPARRKDLQFVLDSTLEIRDFGKKLGEMVERYPVERVELELEPVIRSAATCCFRTHPDVQVQLSWEIEKEVAVVSTDPVYTMFALVCLLDNALEASGNEGRIHVSVAQAPDDMWSIEVADEGSGMEQQLLDRTGRPFESKADGVARGVGLWLARRAAKLMGGRMSHSSAGAGHGVRARLDLPLG